MYSQIQLLLIPFRHSDHCQVLLQTEGPKYETSNRSFRYEVAWEAHMEFKAFVKDKWAPNSNFLLANGIFIKEVKIWNGWVFGHIKHRKCRTLARLAGVNKASHSLLTLEEELCTELHDILKHEKLFWHQKSRKAWITDGLNFFISLL